MLFSVVFCCFVFKEESHRHISRSQLLVLRRQRVEGKRPTADAKILGKIYLLGWEVSSQGFTTYSYVICLLLYVYIYIISKENQNGESWHQKDNSLDRVTQLVTGSARVWTQAIECTVHIAMSWAELSLVCLAAPKSSYKCSIIYRYDYGVWG